ncbi:MAG: hypothetical protein ACI3YD_08930 [Alloprevotella sp.]
MLLFEKQSLAALTLLLAFNVACSDDNEMIVPPSKPADWTVPGDHRGHAYVDLGLPSGTLWARDDVSAPVNGVDSYFFAWGETASKETFYVNNYKYAAGEDNQIIKYCNNASYGKDGATDGIERLQPEDDAATALWGGRWETPDTLQWIELQKYCTIEVVKEESGNVFVFTSTLNGQSIRFESRGTINKDELQYQGVAAYYWASNLSDDNNQAWGFSISPKQQVLNDGKRALGHCVRAVIAGSSVPATAVDLGLPSGLKWASCNIGAPTPDLPGTLYAWGETVTKPFYDFTNYKHCEGTPKSFTKYCTHAEFGTVDGKTSLDPEDDAARQLWGQGWRMPTVEEVEELLNVCTWSLELIGEQKGCRVTGPNGNSIYLPMGGTMWQSSMEYVNMRGFYWTSTLDDAGDVYGEGLFINPMSWSLGTGFTRASGRNIRPVHE